MEKKMEELINLLTLLITFMKLNPLLPIMRLVAQSTLLLMKTN